MASQHFLFLYDTFGQKENEKGRKVCGLQHMGSDVQESRIGSWRFARISLCAAVQVCGVQICILYCGGHIQHYAVCSLVWCDVTCYERHENSITCHNGLKYTVPTNITADPAYTLHTLTKEINKGHLVLYLSAAANKPCTVVMLSGSCNWQWAVMVMVLLNTMQWQSCFTILPYNQMSLKSLAVGRCPAPDFCTGKL